MDPTAKLPPSLTLYYVLTFKKNHFLFLLHRGATIAPHGGNSSSVPFFRSITYKVLIPGTFWLGGKNSLASKDVFENLFGRFNLS